MKRRIITIGLITAGLGLAADAPIDWHHGTVVVQVLGTETRGTTTGVRQTLFSGVQARTTPNIIVTNQMAIDADGYRWAWEEAGEHGYTYRIDRLVLPVGGTFEFYIDVKHNRYVVLDARGKKHFFMALEQKIMTPASAPAASQPATPATTQRATTATTPDE